MLSSTFKKQRGVGLIEVLVTLLILATSLLAMGALQSRSLQFNHSAYLRSQANVLAYDILDRMRINREALANYNRALDDAKPGGGSVTNQDLNEWLTSVERSLPGGQGAIDCNAGVCVVTLEWIEQDSLAINDEAPAEDDEQETTTFSYSTRI